MHWFLKNSLRTGPFYILFLLLVVFTQQGFSQIICSAPDSIIDKYQEDADRMALRKIYRLHLPYEDSIEIPQIISDTFLNALLAVYNATHIPERDTVVTMLDIHTFPATYINKIVVAADTALYWMQLLRQNIIPTGYIPLDSLIAKYDLSIDEYSTWISFHTVTFKSAENLNIPALADAFETLDEVDFADHKVIHGDGADISEEPFIIIDPFPDGSFLNLFYTYGWGDCPSGCTVSRTWWFKIFENCHVEFVNAFGSPLPYTSLQPISPNKSKVFPNPCHEYISLKDIQVPFEYAFFNFSGQIVEQGRVSAYNPIDVSGLLPGGYILKIKTDDRISTHKIIKF